MEDRARQFAQQAALLTVKRDTLRQYQQKYQDFAWYCGQLGLRISAVAFTNFIKDMTQSGTAPSTLKGYFSALLFQLKNERKPVMSAQEVEWIHRTLKGLVYNGGVRTRPLRGSGKMRQVTETAMEAGQYMYVDGLCLAWLCLLRHRELQDLTVDDVRLNAKGGALLWIRQEKRRNARTAGHLPDDGGHFKLAERSCG